MSGPCGIATDAITSRKASNGLCSHQQVTFLGHVYNKNGTDLAKHVFHMTPLF